jgi:hypothetical protein
LCGLSKDLEILGRNIQGLARPRIELGEAFAAELDTHLGAVVELDVEANRRA